MAGAAGMLGGLFQMVGSIFQAGKDVNLGQMNERNVKRQVNLDRDALYFGQQQDRINFLMMDGQQEAKIVTAVVIGAIILVVLAIIIKLWRRK